MYHDSFWYPVKAKRQMRAALESEWGRLFCNWESVRPDARGYPDVGARAPELRRTGLKAFGTSMGILGTCLREAPEVAARRRRKSRPS
jgi:hypothetical protein